VTGPNLIAASAFGSVHGVFNSTAFDIVRNLALCLALVFWLGFAYWVYRDARRRMDDAWLIGTASLLGLTVPYVGPVIYMLVRPPETLDDVRARAIEMRALEERLGHHALHCPICRAEVETGFLVCPVCTTQLKQACAHCAAPLEPSWQMCPYCAEPVVTAAPMLLTTDGLDAALTAEVAASGSNTHGRPTRARKTRSSSR
jgi:RNA polymerase subunit RPABC4/transcription elongation factor Spt4